MNRISYNRAFATGPIPQSASSRQVQTDRQTGNGRYCAAQHVEMGQAIFYRPRSVSVSWLTKHAASAAHHS